MSENSNSQFSFHGSSFDSMIETLGTAFGTFDASPVNQIQNFRWGIDLSTAESAVLITGYHQADFQFQIEPTPDTAEYLSIVCLLYTSPSPRDRQKSRMPSSA